MKIDFEKSHPAVNIDDKRELYQGFVKVSAVCTVLVFLLMVWMFIFLT